MVIALKNLERAGITDLKAFFVQPDGLLYELLRPTVYVRRKVKTLKELHRVLGGGLPPRRESLLKVYGVGEETADVILLYAYGIPTFVVDNYTRRWVKRFFGRDMGDGEIRETLFVNDDLLYLKEMHALIDELGKVYCRGKPNCSRCPLKGECAHFRSGSGG